MFWFSSLSRHMGGLHFPIPFELRPGQVICLGQWNVNRSHITFQFWMLISNFNLIGPIASLYAVILLGLQLFFCYWHSLDQQVKAPGPSSKTIQMRNDFEGLYAKIHCSQSAPCLGSGDGPSLNHHCFSRTMVVTFRISMGFMKWFIRK